jgi:hypothetical protein
MTTNTVAFAKLLCASHTAYGLSAPIPDLATTQKGSLTALTIISQVTHSCRSRLTEPS